MKHSRIRNVRTLRHRHVIINISDVIITRMHVNKFLHIVRIYGRHINLVILIKGELGEILDIKYTEATLIKGLKLN